MASKMLIFECTISLNEFNISFSVSHFVIIPTETLFYPYSVCCIHIIVIWRRILGIFPLFTSSRISVAFICCRTLKGNINGCIWGLETGICLERREIDGGTVFRLPQLVGCARAVRWCFPLWRTSLHDDALSEITVTEVNVGKNTRRCQKQRVCGRRWRARHTHTHSGISWRDA